MLGGFLEYNSMYLGMSSLYVFGIVLYALAYVCLRLDGRAAAALDLRRQEANAARSAA